MSDYNNIIDTVSRNDSRWVKENNLTGIGTKTGVDQQIRTASEETVTVYYAKPGTNGRPVILRGNARKSDVE